SAPVTRSTTVSVSPPTEVATTGTPQAIASSGVNPNGSYQEAHTTTSADRYQAGISSRGTPPVSRTRSATPHSAASARNWPATGSPASWPAGGPPMITSSAPGTYCSARMMSANNSRASNRPTLKTPATPPPDTTG